MNILQGQILVYFAFDVGYAVDLEKLAVLLTSSPVQLISRRKQTPHYLQYARPPLTTTIGSVEPLNGIAGQVQATIFDFGVVSVAFRWPLAVGGEGFPLVDMAGVGSDMAGRNLELLARMHVEALMRRIAATITRPHLSPLVEDYYLFIIEKFDRPMLAQELVEQYGPVLAQALRFETRMLSSEQQADALSERLSYYQEDLVVLGWNAAIIYDQEYEDAANVLELLNIELLEARYVDAQLDRRIEEYGSLARRGTFWPVPFRTPYRQILRDLTELRIESSILSERVNNTLKLIGDLYLGRLYAAAARRFYLHEWEGTISRKLDVIEDFYDILTDRVRTMQGQTLEMVIILLILFEILMALF